MTNYNRCAKVITEIFHFSGPLFQQGLFYDLIIVIMIENASKIIKVSHSLAFLLFMTLRHTVYK